MLELGWNMPIVPEISRERFGLHVAAFHSRQVGLHFSLTNAELAEVNRNRAGKDYAFPAEVREE